MYLISFIYLYLLLGLYLIINNHKIPRLYLGLLIFFIFKWIFNYRKCTFSRIECIVRNVEKEEGYLYRLLETIVDVRNCNHIYLIVSIGLIIIGYELLFKKRYKELFNME